MTLESAPWGEWPEARLVAGEAEDEVRRLKEEPGEDMVVWGSLTLAQSLARAGLVDEYRLNVLPLAIGDGRPLFERMPPMRLLGSKDYDGLLAVRYEPTS